MNEKDMPNPPTDLLTRCLETIPALATAKPAAPRLFLDAGSQRRLGWLSLAAAVPVLTVLAILPTAKWLASLSHDKTTKKATATEPVPYIRIHKWERQLMRNGLTEPDYRVVIYDQKQGRSEWQTDSLYQTIKTPTNDTPFALIRLNNGSFYTEYWRAGRYCSIKKKKRTTRDGLSGYDWARNPKQLVSYFPAGKLANTEIVRWEGRKVEKQNYVSIPDENMAKLVQKMNSPRRDPSYRIEIPEWHSEVEVDPATGLVQRIRKWQSFPSTVKQYPDGILMEEQRFYYQPRSSDADYFDTKRITTGVKLLYGTSKP